MIVKTGCVGAKQDKIALLKLWDEENNNQKKQNTKKNVRTSPITNQLSNKSKHLGPDSALPYASLNKE